MRAEIVRANQIESGNVIFLDGEMILVDGVIKMNDVVHVCRCNPLRQVCFYGFDRLVARMLPNADDPQILRRACEILAEWFAFSQDTNVSDEMNEAIKQARQELENEGGEK